MFGKDSIIALRKWLVCFVEIKKEKNHLLTPSAMHTRVGAVYAEHET